MLASSVLPSALEKHTNHGTHITNVSATSNKSKMLIFAMIVISVVFFVASFVAASLASEQAASNGQIFAGLSNCMTVVTGERTFVDCSTP
jgi:hypothetical protein